jgi:hypothetical protein
MELIMIQIRCWGLSIKNSPEIKNRHETETVPWK